MKCMNMVTTEETTTKKCSTLDIKRVKNSWLRVPATSFKVSNLRSTDLDQHYRKDSVFKNDYKIMKLNKTEDLVEENGHLQDIPSAEEEAKTRISIRKSQVKRLEHIEELILDMIEQQNKITELKADLHQFKNERLNKKEYTDE